MTNKQFSALDNVKINGQTHK